jgi:hypothetical protein
MKPNLETTLSTLGLFLALGCGGALLVLGCAGASSNAPGTAKTSADSDSKSEEGYAVPNSMVNERGSGSVSARIGPPGGSLELTDGPRVEIPPGAVEGSEEFVLKTAPLTTAFLNQESEKPLGPTFVFSPGVEAPSGRTITISFPLSSYPDGWGDVALAYEYPTGDRAYAEDSQHTKWQYEAGKLQGGRAVVQLPAVNGMRLQFTLTNLEAQ